jgi:2-keto-4-pentenoate hydratase
MNGTFAAQAAQFLAEAWTSGDPLAPFPAELAPADTSAGEAIAAELVEALALPVCGLRLAPGPDGLTMLAAPLLKPRMLRAGTLIAMSTLRHARISAGLLGVLAEPLEEGLPVFAAFHPVIDIAASRYATPPADAMHQLADLGGLGLVMVGKRWIGALPEEGEARIGLTGMRPRPLRAPLAALMRQAGTATARWGGLPAGAVLVVAGLAAGSPPVAGQKWAAAIPPVGRISVGLG